MNSLSWVYDIFVDETYVQHFYTNDQIWLHIIANFQSFCWFVSFIVDKLTISPKYMFHKMLYITF